MFSKLGVLRDVLGSSWGNLTSPGDIWGRGSGQLREALGSCVGMGKHKKSSPEKFPNMFYLKPAGPNMVKRGTDTHRRESILKRTSNIMDSFKEHPRDWN